jgi:hypothetical protein
MNVNAKDSNVSLYKCTSTLEVSYCRKQRARVIKLSKVDKGKDIPVTGRGGP